MKRILSLLTALILLLSAVPLCYAAEETDVGSQMRTTIRQTYKKALNHSGRSSLSGFCGRATVCQLWALGIDTTGASRNGNENFPYYRDLKVTDTGYFTYAYSAADFSLEGALNAVTDFGKTDTGTLMVGFSKTSSSAGQVAGHSCVIYGIIDGSVYFAESSLHNGFPEGTPLSKSIGDFAADYNSWATFQGLIEFIPGDELLNQQSTHLYVQSTEAQPLQSPADGTTLRTVLQGENLQVVGIRDGKYKVDDGLWQGYVDASKTKFLFLDYSDAGVSVSSCPYYLPKGENLNLTGTVYTYGGKLEVVSVRVTEKKSGCVFQRRICPGSNYMSLSDYHLRQDLNRLMYKAGTYTVTVQALVSHSYLQNGELHTVNQVTSLWQKTVSAHTRIAKKNAVIAEKTASGGGWSLSKGVWSRTVGGEALKGWQTVGQAQYYFGKNGAVTGWQTIDGTLHYFTVTGVMCIGWIPRNGTYYYMDKNGCPLTGLQTLDGKNYRFDSRGAMLRNQWYREDGLHYYYGDDGLPVSGWLTLGEDTYLFDDNGMRIGNLVTVRQREKQAGKQPAKKVKKTYVQFEESNAIITAAGLLTLGG